MSASDKCVCQLRTQSASGVVGQSTNQIERFKSGAGCDDAMHGFNYTKSEADCSEFCGFESLLPHGMFCT